MIIDAHAHIFSHVCERVAPPDFPDGRFPVDRLLALMDQEGVDRAVLVQNPTIGTINEEVRAAIGRNPDRFAGVIQTDPLAADAPAVLDRFASERQCAVKFEMSADWGWSGVHPGIRLDGAELDRVWEAVSRLRLIAIVDPGAIGNPGYQVEAIDRLSGSHPGLTFVVEHLGYLEKRNRDDAAARARRMELLRLALRPNVHLGCSATGVLLEEPYPCLGSVELLEEAVRLVGADKVLWGTDVPFALRRYSYRGMLDMVRTGAGSQSDGEVRRILGENAARLFFERNPA